MDKKLQHMKLRHVGITVIKQQLEFHYYLLLYSIEFCDFNLRVSYILRVLNFSILKKSRKSQKLVLTKFSENKVSIILYCNRLTQARYKVRKML